MTTPKHELVLLVLLGLLIKTITSVEEDSFLSKAHVSVINHLRPDLELTVHCKSKDDDLGVQVLPYGANFSFHFRPAFMGNTLFWCDMEWKFNTPKHFDIYVDPRDRLKCNCYHYYWSIRQDGPCMFNFKTTKFEFCYPWA